MTPPSKTKLLIVVVETNAANYLAPLLSKWTRCPGDAPPIDWHVFAASYAAKRFSAIDSSIPFTNVDNSQDGWAAAFEALKNSAWNAQALLTSAAGHPLEFAAMEGMDDAPKIQFIDTWTNYRRRFEGPDGLVIGDAIFVIDEHAVNEAIAAGLPGERMVITGQPSWESIPPFGTPPPHSVLFLSAPVLQGYGRFFGYDENDCWDVVRRAKQAAPSLFEQLFFAPHPVEPPPSLTKLDGATLISYDLSILEKVGTVLGMFSSPMIDGFLGGRNVLSIQPGAIGEDACPLSRHGYITRVGSPEHLVQAMQTATPNNNKKLMGTLESSTSRLEAAITKGINA